MTYAVVYESLTGNTAKIAQAICAALPEGTCVACGAPEEAAKKADLIFVGFWTDKGRCPDGITAFLASLEEKQVALFGTAGFADAAYFEKILGNVRELIPSSCRYVDGFMCQGKMPASSGERHRKALEENPEDQRAKMMLRNYESALSHPDERDCAAAAEWVKGLIG